MLMTNDVAPGPGSHLMATFFYGFNRPDGGVMLIMLFKGL